MPFPTPRPVNGVVWHQGSPRREVLDFADPARSNGRFSRKGAPGAWYGSSQEQGAWAEALRHFDTAGLAPWDVKRRVGRVRITSLRALDLTDQTVRAQAGISLDDLVGDSYDYVRCQAVAERAWDAGHEGILSPSSALPGQRTVAVFGRGIGRLRVEGDRVTHMPSRALDLLDKILMPDKVRIALQEALRGVLY